LSEIGLNFRLFGPLKFLGCGPSKNLYISDHDHLKTRHVAKFHVVIPTTAKVIGAKMLKFKPILDTPFKNNLWRRPPS